jgi:hypothetical protein
MDSPMVPTTTTLQGIKEEINRENVQMVFIFLFYLIKFHF